MKLIESVFQQTTDLDKFNESAASSIIILHIFSFFFFLVCKLIINSNWRNDVLVDNDNDINVNIVVGLKLIVNDDDDISVDIAFQWDNEPVETNFLSVM